MPWFKVDDKLHDHRKVRKAGKASMGVWVLAGSWSMDNLTDGFIPEHVLLRWGTRADAGRLVAAGLWYVDEYEGERGWRFHDWTRFQPSAAVTAATKAKEAEAGIRGNHKRWHADRQITDPDCEYCYRDPDRVPDGLPEGPPESGANRPVPEPDPNVSPNGETPSVRADVERVCDHLAGRIASNGSKRPTVTARWRNAARLMLDRDGRSEVEVMRAIDWCQIGTSPAATFWRSNILSMPKLREKFDQMRLQAEREQSAPAMTNIQRHLQLAATLAEREGVQPREIGPA